jgi:hypothetical protein
VVRFCAGMDVDVEAEHLVSSKHEGSGTHDTVLPMTTGSREFCIGFEHTKGDLWH